MRDTQLPDFSDLPRQIYVYFYTSNTDKYLQAKLVFQKAGLSLRNFVSRTKPYFENYDKSKTELLELAVAEVTSYIGHASLVFIEDTSLRIDALSDEGDVPGLQVKEWFQATTFSELNALLEGKSRACTVKSDIALHVPGLDRPVLTFGHTKGTIAESEPAFQADRVHPWLTPASFNGWFIPDGASKPLGAMTVEESWQYDFRIKALTELLRKLELIAFGLNLPPSAYRRLPVAGTQNVSLFPTPVMLVVGPTCAGKTTFAEYVEVKYGAQHVEASSIMRVLANEYRVQGATDFARAIELMRTYGEDIIAKRILSMIDQTPGAVTVVSGFRTLAEVAFFRSSLRDVKIVQIRATPRTRFFRYLQRERSEDRKRNYDQFLELDDEQRSFGLLEIVDDVADVTIENEGTIEDYHVRIDEVVDYAVAPETKEAPQRAATLNGQLFRCLAVLALERRALDCAEISAGTSRFGRPIRHNNVNKILKRVPSLAKRYEARSAGDHVTYEIQEGGLLFLQMAKEAGAVEDTSGQDV